MGKKRDAWQTGKIDGTLVPVLANFPIVITNSLRLRRLTGSGLNADHSAYVAASANQPRVKVSGLHKASRFSTS